MIGQVGGRGTSFKVFAGTVSHLLGLKGFSLFSDESNGAAGAPENGQALKRRDSVGFRREERERVTLASMWRVFRVRNKDMLLYRKIKVVIQRGE